MSVIPEFEAANQEYAAEFSKGALPMPPARRVAILTCMDARLDPAKFLGLQEGDAHVIRNAGGRATVDAVRSLVISQRLLGTNEVAVVHHTDCSMLTFSNEDIYRKVYEDLGGGRESHRLSALRRPGAVGAAGRGDAGGLAADTQKHPHQRVHL